jgi:hypothetical protein
VIGGRYRTPAASASFKGSVKRAKITSSSISTPDGRPVG